MPEGATVVFSAHGVAPAVHAQAAPRGLRTIDATCPLVTKVHDEARRFADEDYRHPADRPRRATTRSRAPRARRPSASSWCDGPDAEVDQVEVRDPEKVVWLSQTTLSVDETMETVGALRERFPAAAGPPSDDICYATQNRQVAVKKVAPRATW